MKIQKGNAVAFDFKKSSYYVVEVAYNDCNPSHRAILHTGFLDCFGMPCSYSWIFAGSYEEPHTRDIYFMDIISEIEMGESRRELIK